MILSRRKKDWRVERVERSGKEVGEGGRKSRARTGKVEALVDDDAVVVWSVEGEGVRGDVKEDEGVGRDRVKFGRWSTTTRRSVEGGGVGGDVGVRAFGIVRFRCGSSSNEAF